MPAQRLHLVRHGEVFNPNRVLYERLEGFELSDRGHQMAKSSAQKLAESGSVIKRVFASPLVRTRQSAQPIAETFGLEIELDDRVIEPWNEFRGLRPGPRALIRNPRLLTKLTNPARPSWGEPYTEVVDRMTRASLEAIESVESGDVVILSHQLPIWLMHLSANDLPLPHNPRSRRCNLSSITSFELMEGRLVEVQYQEPWFESALELGQK